MLRASTMALAVLLLARPAETAETAPAVPVQDKDSHQLFTEANRLFNAARSEAEIRQAVEDYRAILGRGIANGRLYYNLGCAHLRLREIGPAVLNLRRALLFIPQDPRAAATLDYARRQVTDEFPRQGNGKALRTVFFWHYRFPFEARLWAALAAHALFWGLLALRVSRNLPFHRTLMGATLLLSLTAGGSVLIERFSRPGVDGVIVSPETEVRSGNGAGFGLVFAKPVHSGVEARIIETRGNWRQLEFPNEVRGWVIASAVEPVAGEPAR